MKIFSIKRRLLYILMGLMIPLIIFIIGFSFFSVNVLNQKIAEAMSNTVYLQSKNMEKTLKLVENAMAGLITDNEYFYGLRDEKLSDFDKYANAYNVFKMEKSVMYSYTDVAACALISKSADKKWIAFNSNYQFDNTDKLLLDYLQKSLDEGKLNDVHTWFPAMVGDRGYLFRLMGIKDTWIIYVINLDEIILFQDNKDNSNSAVTVFYNDNTIFTGAEFVRSNQIEIVGSDNYYFTGKQQKYMVFESGIKGCDMRIAYLSPYSGLFINMSNSQIMFFVTSMLTIFLIPLGYFLLRRMFFRPIDKLVKMMEEIRDGRFDETNQTIYREIEFQKVDETFRSTLEEIRSLKVESYEKELKIKSTLLQYYQIQIRPHFFLNCLKNIYGMVEEKNYNKIQQIILYLSKHLRYMLQEKNMMVSIEEELQYVKNYISIQQMSMKYPPECTIDVDASIMGFKIPPISLLTFVENTIKYGFLPDENIRINIRINALANEDEELVHIRIMDNGIGFSQEMLELYNYMEEDNTIENRIGIYNVIQRFRLSFGKENVAFAFMNIDGAVVEIYIKRVKNNEITNR